MKRILLFASVLLFLLASCSKGGGVFSTTTEEKKDEVPTVELVDVESYFTFDKSKEVKEALLLVKQVGQTKVINKKNIQVNTADIVSFDEKAGSFKLFVKGTVNGTNFQNQFELTGFKKLLALSDYEIGTRTYAQWNVAKEVYLKDFDLDQLLLYNNTAFYTVDYLKKYVLFSASTVNGEHRQLTDEELGKLTIKDLKFGYDNVITFKTEYASLQSKVESRLDLSKQEYYGLKVKVNESFAKGLYMRGVYEEFALYVQGLLDYDRNIFAAELEQDLTKSEEENSISFSIKLQTKTGVDIVTLYKTAKGFKSLNNLKQDLLIASSADLETYLKSKNLGNKKDDTERKAYLQAVVQTWTQKLQYQIKKDEKFYQLYWNDAKTALIGGVHASKDVYLERPIFDVVSSSISGSNLTVKLKLSSVNGKALTDVVFDLIVRNVI